MHPFPREKQGAPSLPHHTTDHYAMFMLCCGRESSVFLNCRLFGVADTVRSRTRDEGIEVSTSVCFAVSNHCGKVVNTLSPNSIIW